ncbi:MAG TPA: VOC family protein [Mycobacteriales bacterium]|jgi:catechol 2,3-dioxygenase-like lactoylglutathione lyase family enzyme|nr:VOC family protein [Mycobacteriales bacterium]
MATERAVLDGIHHVKIPVTDLVRSREWYERVLGYEVTMEFRDDDGVVRGVGGQPPGLGEAGLALRQEPGAATGLSGFDPIAFGVSDRESIDRWVAQLDAEGVAHSPVIRARIGWVVSFHDPDGVELRLYSRSLD